MTDTPQPGWYPDPDDVSSQRYWNGIVWTDHTAPASSTPPQYPAWTPSVRWQYAVVNLGTFRTGPRLGQVLAYLGRNGWEIAATFDRASNWLADMEKGFVIFKRPVREGEDPDGPWGRVWEPSQIGAAAASDSSLLNELEELTELRDSGVMSQEQFARAEARIRASLAE